MSYLLDGIVAVEMPWVNCNFVDSAEVSLSQRLIFDEWKYGFVRERTFHYTRRPGKRLRNEFPLILEEAMHLWKRPLKAFSKLITVEHILFDWKIPVVEIMVLEDTHRLLQMQTSKLTHEAGYEEFHRISQNEVN